MHNPHETNLTAHPGRGQRNGFTLIELLVVIGILALLISILIPVIGKVQIAARKAATLSEIQQISASIDMYYNDFKSYPGPVAEKDLIGATGGSGNNFCTSSQNLMFGVVGSWEPTAGSAAGTTPVGYFSSAMVGHGAMSFLPNTTYNVGYSPTRSRPFGDVSYLLPQPWNNPYQTGVQADPTTGLYPPEYVDRFPNRQAFPSPILYLRAHVGITYSASDPAITTSDDGAPAQYDNAELSAYGKAYPELLGKTPPPNPATGVQDYATWDAYFQDPSAVTGSPPYAYVPGTQARHYDHYLLISPGPDGVFGTADDIINP